MKTSSDSYLHSKFEEKTVNKKLLLLQRSGAYFDTDNMASILVSEDIDNTRTRSLNSRSYVSEHFSKYKFGESMQIYRVFTCGIFTLFMVFALCIPRRYFVIHNKNSAKTSKTMWFILSSLPTKMCQSH